MSERPRIECFEDLVAWQKARALTAKIYKITSRPCFARDWSLRDQIRSASVSVMSNLAEGFERGRSGEFHQFVSIAKGSCAELRSQLYVLLDAGYIDQPESQGLMTDAAELGRVLGGLRASVQRRRDQENSHSRVGQ